MPRVFINQPLSRPDFTQLVLLFFDLTKLARRALMIRDGTFSEERVLTVAVPLFAYTMQLARYMSVNAAHVSLLMPSKPPN